MENTTTKVLFAALIGAAAGGVAGIMLAPASGKDTRKKITKQAKKLKKKFTRSVDDLQAKGKEVMEKVKSKTEAAAAKNTI